MNDLILNFPILNNSNNNFIESISYDVDAEQLHGKITITHKLNGKSFIYNLMQNQKVKFAISLFYSENSERQCFVCDSFELNNEKNEITATQEISIDFDYAPEIAPYIFALEDIDINVDKDSGLDNFWDNEKFNIPAYSKIAYDSKLTFNSGNTKELIDIECDDSFESGTVKTTVTETAHLSEKPIKVICSKGVFDELKKGVPEKPTDANTSFRIAIMTQIMCYVYSYMNNITDKEQEIHKGLLKHMEILKDKTEQDWEDDDFNASLAATQFLPYGIKELNNEEN
jgi:hypothetical protein